MSKTLKIVLFMLVFLPLGWSQDGSRKTGELVKTEFGTYFVPEKLAEQKSVLAILDPRGEQIIKFMQPTLAKSGVAAFMPKYPIRRRGKPAAAGPDKIKANVEAMMGVLQKEFSIQGKPYGFCFSNSGFTALPFAFTYPEMFKGLISAAARVPEFTPAQLEKAKQLKILLVQGEGDRVVPLSVTKAFYEKLKKAEVNVTLKTYDTADHLDVVRNPGVFLDWVNGGSKAEAPKAPVVAPTVELKLKSAKIQTVDLPLGDQKTMQVKVQLPKKFSTQKSYPAVVVLPPSGGKAENVDFMLKSYVAKEGVKRGFVVVSPVIMGRTLTKDPSSMATLKAWMETQLKVDAQKVFIMGASNGGIGALSAAHIFGDGLRGIIAMPGGLEVGKEKTAVLKGKPVWLMVGANDTKSCLEVSKKTAELLKKEGVHVTLDVVKGAKHYIEIKPKKLFDWFEKQLKAVS